MKNRIKKLFFYFFMAICVSPSVLAQTIRLSLFKIPQNVIKEENGLGHRLPPKPIMAIIDFDSNEIIISQSVEEIETYEIWNENQSALLYSGTDEFDFIQTVANLSGEPITLIMTTSNYSLIGYPD